MKNKKITILILASINVLLAIFLLIGTQYIFPACEGGHGCMNVGNAMLAISIILIAIALSSFIFRDEKSLITSSSIYLVGGFITAIIPGVLLQICKMDSMSCVSKLKPFSIIMGIIMIISSLINILYSIYQLKKANR